MPSLDDDPLSDPFNAASPREHPADWNYPAESRYAARDHLTARRGLGWSLISTSVVLVVLIVEVVREPDRMTLVDSIGLGLLIVGCCMITSYHGRMLASRSWMFSLRRMMGIYVDLPVPAVQYARAVREGKHAASALETALLTVWKPEKHTAAELDQARRTLADQGLPDVTGADYELHPDTPFPWWNRHGIRADQAPLPDLDHQCQPWALALADGGTEKAKVLLRCPCDGYTTFSGKYDCHGWVGRNRRRADGLSASAE
jgi:hypothetical protein